jgi:hypothetical protein
LITIVKADSFPTRYLLVKEPQSFEPGLLKPSEPSLRRAVDLVAARTALLPYPASAVNTLFHFFSWPVDFASWRIVRRGLQGRKSTPLGKSNGDALFARCRRSSSRKRVSMRIARQGQPLFSAVSHFFHNMLK